jgi:hypothetical protein
MAGSPEGAQAARPPAWTLGRRQDRTTLSENIGHKIFVFITVAYNTIPPSDREESRRRKRVRPAAALHDSRNTLPPDIPASLAEEGTHEGLRAAGVRFRSAATGRSRFDFPE